MKRYLLAIGALLGFLGGNASAAGVLPVGTQGIGPLTFEDSMTLAPTNGWSTLPVGGTGASFSTIESLEADVQTRTASSINLLLPQTSTQPPNTSPAGFRYNRAGFFLQSRPTSVAYHLLLATLQNDSGSPQNSLTIAY